MSANKKILIIDDEVDLMQMVGFQFQAKGFDVQTASDGVEALQKVHQFKPDLIILDMNMPRMGGIEFYSEVCGPDGRPAYPILVLTARANIQSLFKDLHIDGFMIKPFEIDRLVHEVQVIIKKRSQGYTAALGGISKGMHRICIVDDDPQVFNRLTAMFLNADYTVIPAKSGLLAIEKMMKEVPDVALVKLGLVDIPGDMLIYKLSQMAKTMEVKFVLYTADQYKHDHEVMERIRSKSGIFEFVEYHQEQDLLDKVNGFWN